MLKRKKVTDLNHFKVNRGIKFQTELAAIISGCKGGSYNEGLASFLKERIEAHARGYAKKDKSFRVEVSFKVDAMSIIGTGRPTGVLSVRYFVEEIEVEPNGFYLAITR